jgi:hypothetical protein
MSNKIQRARGLMSRFVVVGAVCGLAVGCAGLENSYAFKDLNDIPVDLGTDQNLSSRNPAKRITSAELEADADFIRRMYNRGP